MHYCTITLPIHLFQTTKSPEQAQIGILKLPPMSRPNCGIIVPQQINCNTNLYVNYTQHMPGRHGIAHKKSKENYKHHIQKETTLTKKKYPFVQASVQSWPANAPGETVSFPPPHTHTHTPSQSFPGEGSGRPISPPGITIESVRHLILLY